MNKFIKYHGENVNLSDVDIVRMCLGEVSIYTYHELVNFTSPDQIFQNKRGAIILYETRDNYGHWVLLIKLSNNTIEFFDPLGLEMDTELQLVPEFYRSKLNEMRPHLTDIFSQHHIITNRTQFQAVDQDINTCGRHITTRFRFFLLGYDLKNYTLLFKNQRETSDEIVTKLTLFL
jgi:hypothetical protein